MKNFRLALVALALSFSVAAQAQVYRPNKGVEFWAAFLQNNVSFTTDSCINRLRIFAESATTGKVEAPAIGIELWFSVADGGVTEVQLPACMFDYGSGNVGVTGLRISAADSVRAEAVFYQGKGSETTALLPADWLSSTYRVTTLAGSADAQLPEIVIVGTQDSTLVEITPSVDLPGIGSAGVPFERWLDDGRTLKLQAPGDLTGTFIWVKKGAPVAVFQGNRSAAVGDCVGAEPHFLFEQTLPAGFPTAGAGRQYFAVPFAGQGDNYLKILALQNDTRLSRRCDSAVVTLQAGEFLMEKFDSALLISADRQVLVSQFNSSQACHPAEPGSAVMLQLPAANFQTRRADFHVPDLVNPQTGQPYFERFFVNVAVAIGDTTDFWLDGQDIGNRFECGNFFCFAQIEVSLGSHVIATDSSFFQATAYGFSENDGFAHALGYDYFLPECAKPGVCLPQDLTVCVGDTVRFSHCPGVPLDSCFWDFGNGDTSSVPAPAYVFDSVGTYLISFLGVTPDGCHVFSTTIEITVVECCDSSHVPDIQVDGSLCVDSIVLLTAVADSIPNAWVWVLPTGDTLPLLNHVGYLFEAEGDHQFFLFAEYSADCILSDTLVLTIENCGQRDNCLKMPNIFTPNQDGVNDAFRPALACEVGDFSMKIFNRWGGLVFETSDEKAGWNGDQAASDVYVWMVEYVENEASKVKMAGEVTLVR